MRLICPRMDIDWSHRGGLLLCNLPFVDPPTESLHGMRIDSSSDDELVVEVERNEEVYSCLVMACLAIVPCTLPIVMADSSYFAFAWRFRRDSEGRVDVECLRKTAFSESISVVASNVHLAVLETVEEHAASRDEIVLKRRIALLTESAPPLRSPWKVDPAESLHGIVELINQLIPAETRARAVLPPISIPTAHVMDRVVHAEPLATGGHDTSPSADAAEAGRLKAAQWGPLGRSCTAVLPADVSAWDSVPLGRIVERIRLELGDPSDTATLAQTVKMACQELHVEESGAIKLDAIRVARQLGLDPASFG